MGWDTWRLHRRWRRVQRPIAVFLIGGGALLMWGRQNIPVRTVPTALAVKDMPAGHEVTSEDVALAAWPIDSRPAPAASTLEPFIGRWTTSEVRAGEPLTETRVVGPSALAAIGPDRVAVALPEEPISASGVVRPGDRVNVVGQTQMGARTLVTDASVLSIPEGGGPIVAVPAASAAQVVQAAASDSVAVVLLGD